MNLETIKLKWKKILGRTLQIFGVTYLVLVLGIIFMPIPDDSAPEELKAKHEELVHSLSPGEGLFGVAIFYSGTWLIKKDKQKSEPVN